MRVSERSRRASSAILLYVIVLVAFQIFLVTVAVDAFQTGDRPLAWATAVVSLALAVTSAALLRYLRP
jgi:hypothetical protein